MGSEPSPAVHPHTGGTPDITGSVSVGDAAGSRSHHARPMSDEDAPRPRTLSSRASTQKAEGIDHQLDADGAAQVTLSIRCPSLESLPARYSKVTLSRQSAVSDLKRMLEADWPGNPPPEALRFYRAGQLLTNDVCIGDFSSTQVTTDEVAVHLVIRPGPWTESLLRETQGQGTSSNGNGSVPVPTTQKGASNAAKRGASKAQALSHVDTRSSSKQRLSSSLLRHPSMPSASRTEVSREDIDDSEDAKRLGKVVAKIASKDFDEIKVMLDAAQLHYMTTYEEIWTKAYSDSVPGAKQRNYSYADEDVAITPEQAAAVVEQSLLDWPSVDEELHRKLSEAKAKGSHVYKQVEIDGLPYLLQTKPTASNICLEILRKRIIILGKLQSRTEYMGRYFSIFDQTIHNRLADSSGLGASTVRGAHTRRTADAATPAQAIVPRPPASSSFRTLRIYARSLTREDVFAIATGTLFLAFKMGILVFVFTRGASSFKRLAISATAGLYVAYESYNLFVKHAMTRIRSNLRQRRAQQAPQGAEQRREGANEPTDPGRNPTATDGTSQTPTAGSNARSFTTPYAPMRLRHRSVLDVQYWVERLAFYGLTAEDRDLGFRIFRTDGPSHPALQEEPARPPRFSSAWLQICLHDFVFVPFLLFVVTLVPEMEQRRRRAISKREEIIRVVARRYQELETRTQEEDGSSLSHADSIPSETPPAHRPLIIRSSYARRLLAEGQRGGRQLDINQELEAAAALAAGGRVVDQDDHPNHENGDDVGGIAADMGFL